jgi:exopolysaccharide production protein ExoY
MDLELTLPSEHRGHPSLKRLLDFAGSLILMALLSPLLVAIGLVIKTGGSGRVLFRQVRIGRDGRQFWMYKFRTMQDLPEDSLIRLLEQDPQKQLEFETYQKLADDPRLTPAGRLLRRFSLDELPQLWNVVRGEMSLVGPRPFLPEQQELYGEGFRAYCQVRPGLTGLWQVSGRNRLSFSQRAALDSYYVTHWSLSLDLAILARTAWVVVRQDGAY